MREIITLQCGECKRRNYTTTRNKKKQTEKLETSKFCPFLPQAHGPQGNQIARTVKDDR